MRRFFRAIKRAVMKVIGGKARVRHSSTVPVKPIDGADRVVMKGAKVAFVVGHNKRAQGAQSFTWYDETGVPKSVSEFDYWSERFKIIQDKLHKDHSIYVPILFRPERGGYGHECDTVAEELKEMGADVSIHGHFNAAGYHVLGCECLIPETASPLDNMIADYITDLLNRDLGFKERGDDGVKEVPKKHRGSGMLYACKAEGIKASIIFEPAFGDVKNAESKILFQAPEKVDRVMINTVIAVVEGKLKDLDS